MLIKVGYDIAYEVWSPTPMVLMLYMRPERLKDVRRPERLYTVPEVPIEEFTDMFGNRCARIVAPPGTIHLRCDDVIVEDDGLPDPVDLDAKQHPVQELPPEV